MSGLGVTVPAVCHCAIAVWMLRLVMSAQLARLVQTSSFSNSRVNAGLLMILFVTLLAFNM